MERRSVSIEEKHVEYIDNHYINLSKFVRAKLDEAMDDKQT